MEIRNLECKELSDITEVSAVVDGYRLWYRFPREYRISQAADPFVAAALLPAMLQGDTLKIESSYFVSPKFLENLSILQEIHHCWNPVFKIIPVSASAKPASLMNDGAMSFFSGGVDSTYTLLKREKEISHLVFIQGFDFYVNSSADSTLSISDIGDLSQIAYKLMFSKDAVSAFVRDMLSKNALQALKDYQLAYTNPTTLEKTLTFDLNRIIAGKLIYEKSRFAAVRLRPETRRLLEQASEEKNLTNLNRRLLEDAYPLEIAKKDCLIYQTAVDRNRNFAKNFGKTLIPVSTNHFPFGYRYNLSRNLTQGSALASIALLLGFPRAFVPASYSYNQLFPLGSHPLTDPLWSNESVKMIHEGAEARRVDKVTHIAKCKSAQENLRVCFDDMNTNCGKCAKCLRTMIPLELLGVSSAPFPPFPPLNAVVKMEISDKIEKAFFEENYDLAIQTNNASLRDALHSCLRKYECKQLLKDIDKVILGRLGKRIYRRLVKDSPGIHRIDSIPPENNSE